MKTKGTEIRSLVGVKTMKKTKGAEIRSPLGVKDPKKTKGTEIRSLLEVKSTKDCMLHIAREGLRAPQRQRVNEPQELINVEAILSNTPICLMMQNSVNPSLLGIRA